MKRFTRVFAVPFIIALAFGGAQLASSGASQAPVAAQVEASGDTSWSWG
ncbi:hypothetical protein QNO07_10490 [Streptomyces sp. 549]|nr:hypothetical protein [Streptomyces sp. 549]MDK1473843.1 hypothetical protein [Streptomyces sp. 549]